MATSSTASASTGYGRSPYERVEVLQIKWAFDCLNERDRDGTKLEIAFTKYGYGTTLLMAERYGYDKRAALQCSKLTDIVSKWVDTFDCGQPGTKKTLLIITYTGHAELLGDAYGSLYGIGEEFDEAFNISTIQRDCRRRIQSCDLLFIINSPYAGQDARTSLYTHGFPGTQIEVLGASAGSIEIADNGYSTNFATRLARNLESDMRATTVQDPFGAVHLPGEKTGEGVYRNDYGPPGKSIVLAPVRQFDGRIAEIVHPEPAVETLLDINGHTLMPYEGTWAQWSLRPAPSLTRLDEERRQAKEEKLGRERRERDQ